tara:strand:+ start:2519 stop:3469 length:951 start_codon:yes stop_codon:yes gene_type:complete
MDKLLLVGTGSSVFHNKDILKKYSEAKGRGVKILCYSNSVEMFLEEGIDFDYWFFIDPTSAFKAIKFINENFSQENKAPFTLISPYGKLGMPTDDDRKQFFGVNDIDDCYELHGYKTYDDFIEEVNNLAKYKIKKTIEIPFITQKFIHNTKDHSLRRFDLDNKDAKVRFKNDLNKSVMGSAEVGTQGMEIIKDYHKNNKVKEAFIYRYINQPNVYGMMNMCENKLTMCALPVSQFLGAKNLYILGFDGQGGRWDNLDDDAGVSEDSVLNEYYLARWKKWKRYSGMQIYSSAQEEYTNLNNILTYRRLDKLLAKRSN